MTIPGSIKFEPLVSCIVIFFNAGEKFFIEAIESIFAQSYDNWELLLADDGSTDESTTIALRYAQQYPEKVYYVEHEGHQNLGMSATRNLGICHAKGEYIAFLDADDVWLPHKLEQQVPILESHPEAAMLYGRTQFWFSWSDNNPVSWTSSPKEKQVDLITMTSIKFDTVIQPPTQLLLFLQNRNIYPCTCSILIRSNVFKNIGGFEEDFRNAHEDMVFHSKVFLKAPVYVSSKCWDKYRIHPDSYWRAADRQGKGEETRRIGRLKYLNWLETYLSEKKINDPVVWRELKKSLLANNHPTLHNLISYIRQPKQQMSKLVKRIAKQVLHPQTRLWLGENIRLVILKNGVRHIYGLKKIDFLVNDWIVLCVVGNGESYIQKFIEHYLLLGAKHIIFLDNESVDDTIAIASQYKSVTIIQTKYKHPNHKKLLKKYLIQQFAKNQPYIFAEVDELFDYPSRLQKELSVSPAQHLQIMEN